MVIPLNSTKNPPVRTPLTHHTSAYSPATTIPTCYFCMLITNRVVTVQSKSRLPILNQSNPFHLPHPQNQANPSSSLILIGHPQVAAGGRCGRTAAAETGLQFSSGVSKVPYGDKSHTHTRSHAHQPLPLDLQLQYQNPPSHKSLKSQTKASHRYLKPQSITHTNTLPTHPQITKTQLRYLPTQSTVFVS